MLNVSKSIVISLKEGRESGSSKSLHRRDVRVTRRYHQTHSLHQMVSGPVHIILHPDGCGYTGHERHDSRKGSTDSSYLLRFALLLFFLSELILVYAVEVGLGTFIMEAAADKVPYPARKRAIIKTEKRKEPRKGSHGQDDNASSDGLSNINRSSA
jgi:hypothetical protein